MLNFTGSLNEDSGAFAIFVNEKYRFNDKKKILTEASTKKINSFLDILRTKKSEDSIFFFDVSDKQKCFVIKIKNKFKSYWPQECGGNFFSHIKKK